MPTSPSHPLPTTASGRSRDQALAARICAGDEAAFADLHRLYARRVLAFALKRTRDPAEAEDIAQEVFLQVFRGIASYQGRSSLLTWILGIAHHALCSRYRRRRLELGPLDDAARRVAAGHTTPDRVVDAARTLGRCAEALDRRVSPLQRRVFELRYGEARSIESIARDTGRSPGAVRVGLLRTRRALEAALGGELRAAL